jgi:hypothetical protein
MDVRQLGQLQLQTDYIFENGTPFYKKLGDERAAALLRALCAEGYRVSWRKGICRPALAAAWRTR